MPEYLSDYRRMGLTNGRLGCSKLRNLFQDLPQIPAIEVFNRHSCQIEIIEQSRIEGNLWAAEIRSVFAPRTTHLVVSTTPANTTMMMLAGGFVAGISRCTIVFNKTALFRRIVSPQHAALEAKSTIAFGHSGRRLTYLKLCRAAVATGLDRHSRNPPSVSVCMSLALATVGRDQKYRAASWPVVSHQPGRFRVLVSLCSKPVESFHQSFRRLHWASNRLSKQLDICLDPLRKPVQTRYDE